MALGTGPIRAVSLDGDGTLWDFDKVMREALRLSLEELVRSVGTPAARTVTVDDLVSIRDGLAPKDGPEPLDLEELRRRSFAVLLSRLGCCDPALTDRLCEVFFAHRFGTVALYEDSLPALETLSRSHRLILTSNGNSDPRRVGIGRYFDHILFAGDAGYAKPDPRIFRAMLRVAGCTAGEAVHVGDSLVTDVRGAQDADVRAIWLNREAAANETGIRPDATIGNLRELAGLLAR